MSVWLQAMFCPEADKPLTAQNLKKLAALQPKTLAFMHGSSFTGDCARALDDLNVAFRDVFGREN